MFGSKAAAKTAGEAATFLLPASWTVYQEPQRPSPMWAAFQIRKSQSFHFGSGDPLEVEGYVVLMAPGAAEPDVAQGMDFGFRELQVHSRRFPEFGSLKTGSRTTWISEGNYQLGSNHDPEKVLFLRSMDPERQVALVLRVYTRKLSHEALRKIEHEFYGSLRYLDTRAKFFGEQPAGDRAKQQRAAELALINRALASRGLPELTVPISGRSAVEAHDGWVYHVEDGRFWIGRRYALGREDFASVTFANGQWAASGMDLKAAERWVKALALDTDRTLRYRFAVFHFDFTPFDAEQFGDPQCGVADWMAGIAAQDREYR